MAMGSEGKVYLDGEMAKARTDCEAYRGQITTLMGELDGIITTLKSGFQGQAADGLDAFYQQTIVDFFGAGKTFDQFLGMFDKEGEGLFDAIQNAFLLGTEALDPSLGENNRSLSQSAEAQ